MPANYLTLVLLLLVSCMHRRNLLSKEEDLKIFMHRDNVTLEACGERLGPFTGWPNLMRARPLGPLIVLGLESENRSVVIWGCNAYTHEEIGELHGFLTGLPLYTARDPSGWFVRWGDAAYGPYDEVEVSIPLSEQLAEPVFVGRTGRRFVIGAGTLRQGPFDNILGVTIEPEGTLTFRVQIGSTVADLHIKKTPIPHTITSDFPPETNGF